MSELVQIGLGEVAHRHLTSLVEQKHFGSMLDGYRFAIALALAKGARPEDITGSRKNVYAASAVDPDGAIATAIRLLWRDESISVYRLAERLADWGVEHLWALAERDEMDISRILSEQE